MKPFLSLLCSHLLLISACAEAPGPLTLGAVTGAVLAENAAIREAHAKWEAMKQRVPQAAAWEDMKITGSSRVARFVEVSRNSFSDQMLGVEQMIPLSGRNRSRERIATAEALVALEQTRRVELDVIAKARGAYFDFAKSEALLELNRADQSALNQIAETSRAKFEAGGQSQAEVLAAQNEELGIEERHHDLERAKSEAQTQLNVLMNRDPSSPLGTLPDSQIRTELFPEDALRAAMLVDRPEIRMAEAAVVRAKASRELAGREWIPDPALTVQGQRYNDGGQAISELDVGVSMNLPWLNGKKYRAGEKEAASEWEEATQALAGARVQALGLLRDQLQKIETLGHHVELFEKQLIPNARQALQANQAGYEGGRVTFNEFMLSQRAVWELESTAREHLADYQMAVAELEALTGVGLHVFPAGKETK